jgi:nicotinamide-nucleotide amidase
VRSRTLRTTGIAESSLAELIAPISSQLDGVSLAYLPGPDGVDLRITSRDLTSDATDAALTLALDALRGRVTRYAYSDDQRDLAATVLELCERRNLHIGVAESCTGGLLGARLTAIAGSSTVVEGGVIAYSNAVKMRLLGVREATLQQYGAVSEQTAKEMAAGIRAGLGVEIGVGITGVAGPGGGTPDKPVGLVWIAVDVLGDVRAIGPRLIGDRAEIRYRATQAALDLVRRMVAG